MSIYKKLLEMQKKVIGLGKDTESFGYKYVSGGKVLENLKPIMNEVGLILKQEIIEVEKERIDYRTKSGEKSEMLYGAKMKFTWIDVETGEKDDNLFYASGMNDWEKGLGSALTYAERYFLLKYFHINTDEDDIDNPNRKPQEQPKTKPKLKSKYDLPLTAYDRREIINAINERVKGEEKRKKMFESYGVKEIFELSDEQLLNAKEKLKL